MITTHQKSETVAETKMEVEKVQERTDKRGSVSDLFQPNDTSEVCLEILHERNAARVASAKAPKLGTFTGVYVPCLQNLVGVILFLRLTWITSHAGTYGTTLMLFLCAGTTVLTTLSLGAICSNGKIPNGGAYFVIARNLGKEFGSAICLLFYIGKTLSGALYCLGAAEAFQAAVGLEGALFDYDMQVQSILIAILLSTIVFFGLKFINMASVLFLAIVFLSILSCILGLALNLTGVYTSLDPQHILAHNNTSPNYSYDPVLGTTTDFASLLALLYPAVSGFLAGTTRTGLLSNPSVAIPHGTLGAVGSSTLVYLIFIWLFGSTLSNASLMHEKLILSSIAWPHSKILNFGIMFSAIGGALQSFTTAPQVLVAISNDKVLPILRHVVDPSRAVLLTCLTTCVLCLTGDLDVISPIVTMFMLVMYLSVNLACFVLSALRTPSFRPTWKWFHWSTALLGVLWCASLMFIISWLQALLSIALTLVMYTCISFHRASEDWGSAVRGIKLELIRKMLSSVRRMSQSACDVKNWRPQLLVLTRVDDKGALHKPALLDFADQMKKGKGLLEVVGFIRGGIEAYDLAHSATAQLVKALDKRQIVGFAKVNATRSIVDGISMAVQSSGLGEMQSNSVLIGWPSSWRDTSGGMTPVEFTDVIGCIIAARKSLLVLKSTTTGAAISGPLRSDGFIDIWWILHDGGLLMLIPYLLKRHKAWRHCTLRLFTIVDSCSTNSLEVERNLKDYMSQLRIEAKVFVIEMSSTDVSELVSQRTLDMISGRQLLEKATAQQKSMTTLIRQSSSIQTPKHVAEIFVQSSNNENDGSSSSLAQVFQQLPDYLPNMVGYKAAETTIGAIVAPAVVPDDDATGHLQPIDAQRMEHAIRLRGIIMEYSSKSSLIVLNLPRAKGVLPTDFMEYVEVLTEGLDNVLLIRGSGQEVVSIHG